MPKGLEETARGGGSCSTHLAGFLLKAGQSLDITGADVEGDQIPSGVGWGGGMVGGNCLLADSTGFLLRLGHPCRLQGESGVKVKADWRRGIRGA